MKKQYEATYHSLEKKHWWFRGRRSAIVSHIKTFSNKSELKVLDIGCSAGNLMVDLEQIGFQKNNITGIDISYEAIEEAKNNGLNNAIQMDAQNISLEENQFDLIVSSDCLEHLEFDEKALEKWCKLLKKEGKIIIYVPAFMSLWSNHDLVNLHFRRYTKKELTHKLKKAGFNIEKTSYWNFSLFLPVWIVRKLNNLLKKEDPDEQGDMALPSNIANTLLHTIISIENGINRFIPFPFGVSVYAIASKQSK